MLGGKLAMPSSFPLDAVTRALQGAPVRSVEVIERFGECSADVARLRILFFDGRPPLVVIAKRSTGRHLAAARRELRFYRELAPLWDAPVPRLLGASLTGGRRGDDPREPEAAEASAAAAGGEEILMLSEDLGAAGYALAASGPTAAQLRGTIDVLVTWQARFWEALPEPLLTDDASLGIPTITRTAQAWPPQVISEHAVALRRAARAFCGSHGDELSAAELQLLDELVAPWEQQLLARARGATALTLTHGDFHFFGNIFFAPGEAAPRVIDWSEVKPGLPAYDLAYCLHAVPLDPGAERAARDLEVLRSYWERLRAAGVPRYSWELCQWDFQISLVAALFQSLFQDSLPWFRTNAGVVAQHGAAAALRTPPPLG